MHRQGGTHLVACSGPPALAASLKNVATSSFIQGSYKYLVVAGIGSVQLRGVCLLLKLGGSEVKHPVYEFEFAFISINIQFMGDL